MNSLSHPQPYIISLPIPHQFPIFPNSHTGLWMKTAEVYALSQAAMAAGVVELMASTVALIKHETSTLHNFISIDFKFGVGD